MIINNNTNFSLCRLCSLHNYVRKCVHTVGMPAEQLPSTVSHPRSRCYLCQLVSAVNKTSADSMQNASVCALTVKSSGVSSNAHRTAHARPPRSQIWLVLCGCTSRREHSGGETKHFKLSSLEALFIPQLLLENRATLSNPNLIRDQSNMQSFKRFQA